ncbi:putative lipoprotein [Citreicella sp. 357]|nr:putative lipoprotein [Citreicella sp. 357]
MKHALLMPLFFLAACNMGGAGFYGVAPAKRDVEGSSFVIRVKNDMAEAIRTSPEFPARYGPIAARAQKAVFLETGCKPAWVSGDPAVMVMGLSCNGKPAPPEPRRKTVSCDIMGSYINDRLGGQATLECTEY